MDKFVLRGRKKSELLDQEQREALLKHLVECGETGGKEGKKRKRSDTKWANWTEDQKKECAKILQEKNQNYNALQVSFGSHTPDQVI